MKSLLKKPLGFFGRLVLRLGPLRVAVLFIINKFPKIKSRLRKIVISAQPVRKVGDLSSRGRLLYEELKMQMKESSSS